MTSTRRYFERHARAFDRLYARRGVLALGRRGPQRTRDVAASVVERHPASEVLDLGCGPGRVGEAVLDAGAGSYVGVDFSRNMLELARERLARFEHVELVDGNFLELDLPRGDVVLALGLFEYLDEPERAAAWMHAHCSATLVASFTSWDWVKGPPRHAYYRLLHACTLHDYAEADAIALLRGAGFSGVELVAGGRRGFTVTATP